MWHFDLFSCFFLHTSKIFRTVYLCGYNELEGVPRHSSADPGSGFFFPQWDSGNAKKKVFFCSARSWAPSEPFWTSRDILNAYSSRASDVEYFYDDSDIPWRFQTATEWRYRLVGCPDSVSTCKFLMQKAIREPGAGWRAVLGAESHPGSKHWSRRSSVHWFFFSGLYSNAFFDHKRRGRSILA